MTNDEQGSSMKDNSGSRHELQDWSTEDTLRLIQEYRDRPDLWDYRHPRYRLKSARIEHWKEMATLLGSEPGIVRRKLNSILASWRRERNRVRAGKKTNWLLYQPMSFLPNHADEADYANDEIPPTSTLKSFLLKRNIPWPRPLVREVAPSPCPSPELGSPDMEVEYLEYKQGECRDSGDVKMEPELVIQPRVRPRVARPARLHYRPARVARPPARPRRPVRVPNTRRKDECDSFGEYIADSLRKHDGRTQSLIKQAMNNILFEQEMNKYSGAGRYPLLLAGHEE